MEWLSYSEAMGESNSYLTVTLDLAEPIEISDFAAFFAGLGSQFDDYLEEHHPELKGTARLYVREVRDGSIVADLVPIIRDIIGLMDDVIIISGFIQIFKQRIYSLAVGRPLPEASKDDIKHIAQAIRAIAHDKDGTAKIEQITYRGGVAERELVATFSSPEARQAMKTIEGQQRTMKALPAEPDNGDHERVLMRYIRPDFQDAAVGKKSGELVVIEEISPKPMALIYGSELVEERLKDETRDHESIFYKGFVVDVHVMASGGRSVAYTVKTVHQVIELPKPD